MHEKQSLTKMIKKVLNVNFLKFQQLMINIKSLNVYVFFFNTHSSEILNLKKRIKEKDLIFVKINVTQ